MITFATDTWAAAWRWCSLRIASSEVISLGGEVGVDRGAHCGKPRTVLAQALQELNHVAGVEGSGRGGGFPWPAASIRAT